MMTPEERFEKYVSRTADCWLWTGWLSPTGYGQIRLGGIRDPRVYVHRYAYEQAKGPIPLGHEIDHLCRVRHCVNPDHLEAVTHQVNQMRAGPYRPRQYNVGETCRSGHPRTPENTGVNTYGARFCRPCKREAVRRSYAARSVTA